MATNAVIAGKIAIELLGLRHNGWIEAFFPIGGIRYDIVYLIHQMSYQGHF
jgi:hypothetical protein